ncbi:MAG: rRNA maturation RNase YbeY [Gammaproteobacteria bacterium]
MPISVSIQRAYRGAAPSRNQILRWTRRALAGRRRDATLTVRIVDAEESASLNETWRHRKGPTNVLSFPVDGLEDVAPTLLGDIVVCAPIVELEAADQGKSAEAHWAHMIVHGTLHLLGFDHVDPGAAREMEALERSLLADLGYPDPYEVA